MPDRGESLRTLRWLQNSLFCNVAKVRCEIVAGHLRREPQSRFMRLFTTTIAAFIISLFAAGANAQSPRQQFTVPTPSGRVLVESFGSCASGTCPAVLILSGSKGFAASVYDEIGQAFRA